MTEPHGSHESHGHGPTLGLYLAIGLALTVVTAVSVVVNLIVRQGGLSHFNGFVIILAVALIKATLVGLYFMHLKYDWGKVGFMIIPAFILGAMMMCVLLPDIVLAWWADDAEAQVVSHHK